MAINAKDYSFQGKLLWSHGVSADSEIKNILLEHIPGAVSVEPAELGDDKKGTDHWVFRAQSRPLSVDLKARTQDPIESFGEDDLALEIWSVEEKRKIGWTLDESKETDYILWYFSPTGRWVLIPFPMLCKVFQDNGKAWEQTYKTARQSSNQGQWHSYCVFVPRKAIWAALYHQYGGEPMPPSKE